MNSLVLTVFALTMVVSVLMKNRADNMFIKEQTSRIDNLKSQMKSKL